MLQLEIAVIGFIQAIVVVILGGLFARDSRKRRNALDNAETRAILRAEESRLSMKLMSSGVNLGIATAIAIKEGRMNGQMDTALAEAAKTEAEYYDFINAVASKQIVK